METKKFIPLSKLPLSDNFMFGEVMRNKEMCKLFLEELFRKRIARIEFINREQDLSDAYQSHGIRLDVYLADEKGTRYDVEMQNANHHDLERRSRYYQSGIDRRALEKGQHYTELPESYVIFICNFDYFGAGLALYERMATIAQTGHPYDDGSHVLFLNANYQEANVPTAISEFLACIKDIDDPHTELSTELGRMAHDLVQEVRQDETKEVAYMTYVQKMWDERMEGRVEGRAEGRTEGRAELAAAMEKLGTKLQELGRMDDIMKAMTNHQYARALMKELGIKVND